METLAILFGILLFGSVLVMYGTAVKNRWGINPNGASCLACGSALPIQRAPRTIPQALWGGGTCAGCGAAVDKWGRPLGGRIAFAASSGEREGGRTAGKPAEPGAKRPFWNTPWFWIIPVLGLALDAWLSGAVLIDGLIAAALVAYGSIRR